MKTALPITVNRENRTASSTVIIFTGYVIMFKLTKFTHEKYFRKIVKRFTSRPLNC